MDIEQRNLNIPLKRRRWMSTLKILVATGVCAWLWHTPNELHAVLITLLLGAPALWVGFGPAFVPRKYHHRRDIQFAYRIGALALLFFVMNWLVPVVSAVVGELL